MTNSIPLSSIESSPTAKFVEIGDKYSGRIVDIDQRQQTSMDGELQTFKDGSPRMMYVISLELPDGEVVTLFAKNGNYTPVKGEGEAMLKAIGLAMKAADMKDLKVSDDLAVAYTGDAEPAPGKKAKLYKAQAKAAQASVPVDDLFSDS